MVLMLMANERSEAIRIITRSYCNAYLQYGNDSRITELLTNGHKGFANFSDAELLRALQTLARTTQVFEAQQFITTLAMDKFVLEEK